jgi:hypothetical protein
MSTNIPNRIKQPGQCCLFCGKSYVKKTNLNNHIVICELLHKNITKTNDDEIDEIPSQKKMYQMILEIGKKLNGLDEKVDEINKWVIKKKRKINIIEWLNTNSIPHISFDILSNEILIIEDDIKTLFDYSYIEVLNQIFSRTIYNMSENKYPIFAFVQKPNTLYIYENEQVRWSEITKEKLVQFLDKIYIKISRAFTEWKKNNKKKIENDENFQLSCDKTSVKMYSIDLKNETIFGKIKSNIYTRMKTDMKALIEYEFEF